MQASCGSEDQLIALLNVLKEGQVGALGIAFPGGGMISCASSRMRRHNRSNATGLRRERSRQSRFLIRIMAARAKR